jgi:pyrroloquinoline quinone (PQQ) biosynthesis protein C
MQTTTFQDEAVQMVHQCLRDAPMFEQLALGQLSPARLRRVALNQYGEIRSFIDFKLPERLRICPHDAASAKRYFWYLYREEQGNFEPGRNHAELFLPIAAELGLTQDDLDEAYRNHVRRYEYMKEIQPSVKALVRELAISFSWESFMPLFGARTIAAAKNHYGIKDVSYFTEHSDVDPGHSDQAVAILGEWASSDELKEIARAAIRETLVDDLYLAW